MPLDEATRRLAFLLQRDLRRLVEREQSRADRGEEVRYDSASRMATWETRRGDVIGRWYGEIIATYAPKDRILHWAWAGRASVAIATHAEVVFREGQSRSIPQLAMTVVAELDEAEARTLARLGVLLARGEGLEVRRTDSEVVFIGLFDSARPREGVSSNPSRYSVPPPAIMQPASSPPTHQRSSTPPPAPYRSLPPIREIYGPRSPRKPPEGSASGHVEKTTIREPSRATFIPVATAVLATLTKLAPGYQQALFVVTVHSSAADSEDDKRRLLVVLVALCEDGVLRSIDLSSGLVDTTARMVEADRANGNGPWRKLSARITPKPDGGATLNVDVI